MSNLDKFKEYKLFVEDTARFSDRRQMVTNIYIAVNTILLGGVALLIKDAGLEKMGIVLSTLALLVAGIAICLFWYQLITKYKDLVAFRLNELREIEKLPDMEGCHQMYHMEDKLYPRDENDQLIKKKGINFSDIECRLPLVFIIIYTSFILGIIFALIFGLI